VFAIDLLGFGGSAKPILDYNTGLWRDLVKDFLAEFVKEPAVLVGNSLGSLICLEVAAASPEASVGGLVLLNCAGGMNNKAVRLL
jgi:pimeloyl-ACP methyl ester carboxylesterase